MEPIDMLLGLLVVLLIIGIIAAVVLLWQHTRPGGGSRGKP